MPQLQFNIDWPGLVGTNIERVRRGLEDRGIDLLFANDWDNVRYLTGYSPLAATAFVHSGWVALARKAEAPILFAMPFYVNSIKRGLPWIKDVRGVPRNMAETIKDLVGTYGLTTGRIGFDGYLLYSLGKQLEEMLPTAEIVNAQDVLANVRALKTPQEVAIIERCLTIGEIGMQVGIEACAEGNKEYEVAAAVEFAMRSEGAEGYPFSALVTSGENGAIMQEMSTDKYLRRGDVVLLDLGCMFEGYFSDFARTVVVGDDPRVPELPTAYKVVHNSIYKAIEHMRPGVKGSALDDIARGVIREAGYGEHEAQNFLGHGIGMTVWEFPIIDEVCEAELQAGMVINIEPGIFKPGLGGIRLEETVLITPTGHEILTRSKFCDAFL